MTNNNAGNLARVLLTVLFLLWLGNSSLFGQTACLNNQQALSGDVNVKRREYHQFLTTDAPQFLGGEHLSMVATGQIDVNFQEHHDRHCNLFGFLDCHTDDWIEHHPKTPDQQPVTAKLVDDSGNGPPGLPSEFVITTATSSIDVPASPFDKPYHLEAWIPDATIKGSMSSGQYTITVNVDGTGRNAALANLLNQTPPPTAAQLDKPQVLDTNFVRGCAAPIAEQLARHAKKFPATQADTRDAQLALLKLALKLDPANPSITLALAQYYRQTGNLALANKTARDALEATEQAVAANPSRVNKQKRANAYLEVGRDIEEERASLNVTDLQDALTYYARSAQGFEEIRDFKGLPESLVRQARALRRMRSEASLAAAAAAYTHALTVLPRRLNGVKFVSVSPDHKFLLVEKIISGVALGRLGDDLKPIPNSGDYIILAQDEKGRLLVRNRDSLLWYTPEKPDAPPSLAAARALRSAVTSGGTILGDTEDWRVIVVGSDGVDREVFNGAKGGFVLRYALGGDGKTYAFYDGTQILVKRIHAGGDIVLRSISQPDIKGVYSLAIAPDGSQIAAGEVTATNNLVRLWKTSDGSSGIDISTAPLPASFGFGALVSFSPDGHNLGFSVKGGELNVAGTSAPYTVRTYAIKSDDRSTVLPSWIDNTTAIVASFPWSYATVNIVDGTISDISSQVRIPRQSVPWFYKQPSGLRIAANQYVATLQCYSIPEVSLRWEKLFPDIDPGSARVLSGGGFVLAQAQNGKSVSAIDLSTNEVHSVPFEVNSMAFTVAGQNKAQWFFVHPQRDGSLKLDQFSGTEVKNTFTFLQPVARFGQTLQQVQQGLPPEQSGVNASTVSWVVVPAVGNDSRTLAVVPSIRFDLTPGVPFKPVAALSTDFRLAGSGLDAACTVTDSLSGPNVLPRVPVVTLEESGAVHCTDITVLVGTFPIGFSSFQTGHLLVGSQFAAAVFLMPSSGVAGSKIIAPTNLIVTKESSRGDRLLSFVQTSPSTYNVVLSSISADGSITSIPCSQCAPLDISIYRQRMQKELPGAPYLSTWPTEVLGRSFLDIPDRMSFVTLVSGDELAIQDVDNDSIALSMPLGEPVYQDDGCLVVRQGSDIEIVAIRH